MGWEEGKVKGYRLLSCLTEYRNDCYAKWHSMACHSHVDTDWW